MANNPYDYGVLATMMFDDDKPYVIEGRDLNRFVVQLKHDLATKKFDYEMQYDWEKRLEAFLWDDIDGKFRNIYKMKCDVLADPYRITELEALAGETIYREDD